LHMVVVPLRFEGAAEMIDLVQGLIAALGIFPDLDVASRASIRCCMIGIIVNEGIEESLVSKCPW
jgi:hypothetical protein